MKIEIGESLFYSWLRHVKDCQLVQMNWKMSPAWTALHEEELQELFQKSYAFFEEQYGYQIFKKVDRLSQLMGQTECDLMGMSIKEDGMDFYAVEVAFHDKGLNYGSKEVSTMKVLAKCVRAALALYAFFNTKQAEIIFASPKINNNILELLLPCIADLNKLFAELGYEFKVRIVANEEFKTSVLDAIILASQDVADTAELFVRSYQLLAHAKEKSSRKARTGREADTPVTELATPNEFCSDLAYKEMKIGKLAKVILRQMLIDGLASDEEVALMQDADYSKEVFGLQYPLLVKDASSFEKRRYYAPSLLIRGISYRLCSQWFEVPANNDRPLLERWISLHQ